MSKVLFSKELTENFAKKGVEFDCHEGTYGKLGRKIASFRWKTYDGETWLEVDFPLWDSPDQVDRGGHINFMIVPKGEWAGHDPGK